jgi:hypothetical protein
MDITDSFRSRPQVAAQTAYYNQYNNVSFEGVVQSVSFLDRLEGTAVVFLPLSRTYVRAYYDANYKSSNNIGVSNPLIPGDKVRVQYLSGNSSQAIIVGHSNWKSLIPKVLNSDSRNVPSSTTNFGGGLPGTSNPESLKWAGLSHTCTYPKYDFFGNSEKFVAPKPGAYTSYDPVGNVQEFTPGIKSTYSTSEVHHNLDSPLNLQDTSIKNVLDKVEAAEQAIKWATFGTLSYTSESISWDQNKPAAANQEDRNSINDDYTAFLEEYFDELFDELELDIKFYDQKTGCIRDATKKVQDNFRSFVDNLLQDLVSLETSAALDSINKLLPDELQISLNVEKNEAGQLVITNVRVGDFNYDPKTSLVKVNGQVFNPFINSSLKTVNKLLPNFYQVSASSLGISIGDITIDTSQIDISKTQEFLVKNGTWLVNETGKLFLRLENTKISLGDVVDFLGEVEVSTSLGSKELNKILPDNFQAKVTRDEDDNKIINFGPFRFKTGGKDSGLSIDQVELTSVLENTGSGLFKQNNSPAGMLGKMLWKPASSFLAKEISNLINKPSSGLTVERIRMAREKIKKEKAKASLSTKVDPCGDAEKKSAIPPTIIQELPSNSL